MLSLVYSLSGSFTSAVTSPFTIEQFYWCCHWTAHYRILVLSLDCSLSHFTSDHTRPSLVTTAVVLTCQTYSRTLLASVQNTESLVVNRRLVRRVSTEPLVVNRTFGWRGAGLGLIRRVFPGQIRAARLGAGGACPTAPVTAGKTCASGCKMPAAHRSYVLTLMRLCGPRNDHAATALFPAPTSRHAPQRPYAFVAVGHCLVEVGTMQHPQRLPADSGLEIFRGIGPKVGPPGRTTREHRDTICAGGLCPAHDAELSGPGKTWIAALRLPHGARTPSGVSGVKWPDAPPCVGAACRTPVRFFRHHLRYAACKRRRERAMRPLGPRAGRAIGGGHAPPHTVRRRMRAK